MNVREGIIRGGGDFDILVGMFDVAVEGVGFAAVTELASRGMSIREITSIRLFLYHNRFILQFLPPPKAKAWFVLCFFPQETQTHLSFLRHQHYLLVENWKLLHAAAMID